MGNISQEITNGKFGPMKLLNNHTSSKIKCEDQSAKIIVTCWLHYVYNRAKFGKKCIFYHIKCVPLQFDFRFKMYLERHQNYSQNRY